MGLRSDMKRMYGVYEIYSVIDSFQLIEATDREQAISIYKLRYTCRPEDAPPIDALHFNDNRLKIRFRNKLRFLFGWPVTYPTS